MPAKPDSETTHVHSTNLAHLKRVVIIGGGYAGVMAANRLAGLASEGQLEVVLIDPGDSFTERIRLHRVAAGSRDSAQVPWSHVLHPRVGRMRARVSRIDVASQYLEIDGMDAVSYDWLVYAVGSGELVSPLPSISNTAAAMSTREQVAGLQRGASLRIIGAGLTGIEFASAAAVTRPDLEIRLLDRPAELSHPSAHSSPSPIRSRPTVAKRLDSLGIKIESGTADAETGAVKLADGSPIAPADLTVWTAGFGIPQLAAQSGLPVDDRGRLLVDETLAVPSVENIIGAGDAITVGGSAGTHLRASCATSLPLGAHAADTVLAQSLGQAPAPAPADAGYFVQCLDLGERHGHAQLVRNDDTPRAMSFSGITGGWIKEQICKKTIGWLRQEMHRPGSFSWPRGPRN